MSTEIKCSNCGSDEIDYDPARGDAACVACGTVVQQSLIVNEVSFAEDSRGRSNMVGQHVGADGQPSSYRSVLPGHSPQATANTMYNARKHMFHLASQLGLSSSSSHIDQAVRLYRLAVERNFHKGRRIVNLSCACLYIICRLERTPHMLLDFADISKVNVFTLGHTFLKLVRLLEIQLPLIDPSLYMHRFAAKLEFGDTQNAVAMTALRIAARMQRDWLTHGRRPAGLCGAALLTAAVMHNFYRSTTEVARVVRIGNVVLKNRLREFDQTPTASMTAEQIDAGGGDDGKKVSLIASTLGEECQPPAFMRSQQKKQAQKEHRLAAQKEKEDQQKQKEIPTDSNNDDENNDEIQPSTPVQNKKKKASVDKPPMSEERRKEIAEMERSKQFAADDRVESLMAEALATDEMRALDHESEIAHNLKMPTPESGKKKRKRTKKADGSDNQKGDSEGENDGGDETSEGEQVVDDYNIDEVSKKEDLSDLDDDDCLKYISTEEEFKQKEKLWTETNKDYLERQARLEIMKRERPEEYKRLRPGAKKKRTSYGPGAPGSGRGSASQRKRGDGDAGEPEPPPRKASKKLNYQVLQSLAQDDNGPDL